MAVGAIDLGSGAAADATRTASMSSLADRSRTRRAAPLLYLLGIGIALSAVHVATYRQLSPIDELRHVDYAMSVTHLHLVRLGDRVGQEAMRAEACRGVDLPTWLDPPCRSTRFNPVAFRDDGYQTASAHPPTYYLTVGLVSRAAVGLGLFDNFVDPARLMGGVLLGAGLVLTYLAGLRLGLRSGALLAALTLVPTTSAVLHASSTVNPDATAVLAGGLVLFAAVAWEQRRLGTLGLAAAGAVATGLKLTNLLAVAAVAAWLVVRSDTTGVVIGRVRAGWRKAGLGRHDANTDPTTSPPVPPGTSDHRNDGTRAAVALVAGAVAAGGGWLLFDRLRATIDPAIVPQNRLNMAHGIPALSVIFSSSNLFSWFPPIDGFDPVVFKTTPVTDFRVVIAFLFAGAMLLAMLRLSSRKDSLAVLGAAGTAVALVAAPLFLVVNTVVSNVNTDPTPRYGMSLLPVMVVVLASMVRRRSSALLLGAFAGVAYTTLWVTIVLAQVPKPLVH
jgi:hypothetical protein